MDGVLVDALGGMNGRRLRCRVFLELAGFLGSGWGGVQSFRYRRIGLGVWEIGFLDKDILHLCDLVVIFKCHQAW